MTLPTVINVEQLVPVPAGKPKGGLNCNPAVTATQIGHATGGRIRLDAWQVRDRMIDPETGGPDVTGGTNLTQADQAALTWGVDIDVRYGEQWSVFRTYMQRHPRALASLSIEYAQLRGTTAYASRTGFGGNHQVAVRWLGGLLPWELYDPLADGKRGVPRAPVRVSDTTLRRAAGYLRFKGGRRLGVGRCYVGIVEAPVPAPVPVVRRYSVRFTTRAHFLYADGADRESRRFARETSAPCSEPMRRTFADGRRRRVVRVLRGLYAGRYVEPGRDGVTLVER